MTNQEKKEYMGRYRRLMNLAKTLSRRAIELRSMCEGISASIITGMPRGTTKHDFTDFYDKVVEAEIERDRAVDEADAILTSVVKAAAKLNENEEAVILNSYIDGWSIDDIMNSDWNKCEDGSEKLAKQTLKNIKKDAVNKIELNRSTN